MPKTIQEMLTTQDDREMHGWVLEITDKELDQFISLTSHRPPWHNIGLAERQRRHFLKLSKPHCSVTPGFIVGFLAMVFAAIAAWPVILEWIQSSQRVNKDSSSQLIQSNSMPVTPPTLQISPPATNVAPGTNLLK